MTRLFAYPEPIPVELDADGVPVRFSWHGGSYELEAIANRWRVNSTWWIAQAAAVQEYFKLTTTDVLLCSIYRDLANDAWYMARVYN